MAQPALSITYTDLCRRVARYLGYKALNADRSTTENQDIDDIVQGGVRQFLYPPKLDGEDISHAWSFLSPKTLSIATVADTDTYDLPDDFGGLCGSLAFSDTGYWPVEITDEERIRLLNASETISGRPYMAGIRPKEWTAANGQEWEIEFYPTPDGVYTLAGRYEVVPAPLSDSNLYPLGGAIHGETYIESCLAYAERMMNDTIGEHNAMFMQHLATSIAQDRQKFGGDLGGYNGDTSDLGYPVQTRFDRVSSVTYPS